MPPFSHSAVVDFVQSKEFQARSVPFLPYRLYHCQFCSILSLFFSVPHLHNILVFLFYITRQKGQKLLVQHEVVLLFSTFYIHKSFKKHFRSLSLSLSISETKALGFQTVLLIASFYTFCKTQTILILYH